MTRLRTEGGSVFILGMAAMFGAAGLYFAWAAAIRGDETVGAAVVLLGMAGLLLVLGGQEILTDIELLRRKLVVPATVTAIEKSPTMNVNYTLHRWRLTADGILPDGRSRTFVSPYILAAEQPAIALGTTVLVNVVPRTGRYKMDLGSLPRVGGEAGPSRGTRGTGGWRSRRFLLAGSIVLIAWVGATLIDRTALGTGWIAVPLGVGCFLIDILIAFAAMLRRLRARAAGSWSAFDPSGRKRDADG